MACDDGLSSTSASPPGRRRGKPITVMAVDASEPPNRAAWARGNNIMSSEIGIERAASSVSSTNILDIKKRRRQVML